MLIGRLLVYCRFDWSVISAVLQKIKGQYVCVYMYLGVYLYILRVCKCFFLCMCVYVVIFGYRLFDLFFASCVS